MSDTEKTLSNFIERGKFYKVVINQVIKPIVHYGYLLEKSEDFLVFDTKQKAKYIVKVSDINIITEVENGRD